MKKERGITLIALVITIIVLLILAGVSLSFVLGNNGVLTQSKTSVTENKKATAKEEVTMAWAACETDYSRAWAEDSSVNKADFFEGNNGNPGLSSYLKTGTLTNFLYGENSTLVYEKSASEKYALTVNSKGEVTEIVEVSGQSGEQQSGPAGNEEEQQSNSGNNSGQQGGSTGGNSVALSTLTSTNYGDYIDLGQNVIGESATTDDWRIIYNDTTNNVVYAILADYLPNNNPAVVASGLETSGTYIVYSNTNRETLLAGLNHATAWNSLIPNSLISRGASVKGAPSKDIMYSSYNEKYGLSCDISSNIYFDMGASYNYEIDNAYRARSGFVDSVWGYWLNYPYEYNENMVNYVHGYGCVSLTDYDQTIIGVCPMVSLPSNIQVTNNNGIWSLAE